MNEFDLIRTYFARQGLTRNDVVVSIGDDAAVIDIPAGMQQVVTTDALIAGTHFLADAEPASVGHKALAVNFSDLAAMGATPTWFTLNLTLPAVDDVWLKAFCEGVFTLANEYQAQLVGGDTVRGPLAVCIQAYGLVPAGKALLRTGAKSSDRIYVTGVLGDAALGLLQQRGRLSMSQKERACALERLNYPAPRVAQGIVLRDLASSCIDISDGLLADLEHILQASGVGARVFIDQVPLSAVYRAHFDEVGGWELAITNGDDYELCFTASSDKQVELESLAAFDKCGLTCIGDIEPEPGLRIVDSTGKPYEPKRYGYDHFANPSSEPPPTRGSG
ncbi:MAG: thiamine-phosphate kinase [Acidiferrobacterales bacterium]